MRIMYDTNVLLSALVLRSSVNMHALLIGGYPGNQRLLSSFVIDEINDVVERKWPDRLVVVMALLSNLSFEKVELPEEYPHDLFSIRDPWDYPVLYSAYISHADLLITGDKDFTEARLPGTKVLTPRELVNLYA